MNVRSTKYDRDAFFDELQNLFPEAADEIDREVDEGLIHLEMSAFSRYTMRIVERGDRPEAIRCFQFAERLILQGDADVWNAVHVSYLEHLLPEDDQEWMFEAMTSAVRQAWFEIHEYVDRITGRSVTERWSRMRAK